MAKKVNYFNYLCAFQLLQNNIQRIARNENETDDVKAGYEVIFRSQDINPERLMIKMEEYDQLSNEAKEIISTILNCPEEILELFKTPKLGKISRRMIFKVFSDIWKSKLIADSAVKEISRWVKTF
ncbi:MAG: hypothetical protein PVG39_00580 [Desulfobacteraceae bacterium]|jgi:hypothetical protein